MLGLATGSTPIGAYRELVRMHREEGLSFADVITFNLDEYYPMDPGSLHSYHRFMWENLFSQLDILPENVHIPRGDVPRDGVEDECRRYEEAIEAAGGIDLQLLGIGRTGHIGFNEPGSGLDSRTRLVTLDLVTRKDTAADFFGEENVPREAITMGVATILDAREILILATGSTSRPSSAARSRAKWTTRWPPRSSRLIRRRLPTSTAPPRPHSPASPRPGCSDPVEWTPGLKVRAVIWLSHQTGKAILKLTQSRLRGASSLVARGPVELARGAQRRGVQRARRQDSRPLEAARGTSGSSAFRLTPTTTSSRWVGSFTSWSQNGNEITVAYMTSGNLAVFDHDVRRHLDFLRRLARERRIARRVRCRSSAAGWTSFLARKRPGDVDIEEVQDIKRMIRESEAVAGVRTLGLDDRAARFLDLPFYQTGKVKKDPIGPRRRGHRARAAR